MAVPSLQGKEVVAAIAVPIGHITNIREYVPFNNTVAAAMQGPSTAVHILQVRYEGIKYDRVTGEIVSGLPKSYVFFSEIEDTAELKRFRDKIEKVLQLKIEVTRMWV